MKKLKKVAGETLVETLVALLILTILMTMLPTVIVTSAKLNKGAEDVETFCTMGLGKDGTRDKESCKVDSVSVFFMSTGMTDEAKMENINVYESEGFYFYESK